MRLGDVQDTREKHTRNDHSFTAEWMNAIHDFVKDQRFATVFGAAFPVER